MQSKQLRLVTESDLDDREIKWDSVTRTWSPRNPVVEWGVRFNSANDPTATQPTDPNIKIGDEWVRHPDSV
jgi:hypothetical protein